MLEGHCNGFSLTCIASHNISHSNLRLCIINLYAIFLQIWMSVNYRQTTVTMITVFVPTLRGVLSATANWAFLETALKETVQVSVQSLFLMYCSQFQIIPHSVFYIRTV